MIETTPIPLVMSRGDVIDRARTIGEDDARLTLPAMSAQTFARRLAIAQVYGYSARAEYRSYREGYQAHAW